MTPEQAGSFRAELDALRQEYAAKVGDADAEYIRNVRTVARGAQVAGRALIHFSLDPVSWAAGVAALAVYKVLENMEIGHNVLHGQYDFLGDPTLSSATYEWDMVGTAKSWKRAHNATHHVFTNVIGRDRDFGYNAFRFSGEIPWRPFHLLQPVVSPLSGLFFQYSIGAYDLGLLDALGPKSTGAPPRRRATGEVARELWAFARKAARKVGLEYALYPALAGPLAPKVFAGNALANALRNGWAYVVIYCGHLTERTATFREEDLEGEDRAGWYARQVAGSSNFEASRLVHVLSGHLGFQIEHHLFPNLPAWRYPELAPRVRDICERYGLPYSTGSLASQFTGAMRRLVRFAVPTGRASHGAVALPEGGVSRPGARAPPGTRVASARTSTALDPARASPRIIPMTR